jgi:multidrug efflux pump subunit AcrB
MQHNIEQIGDVSETSIIGGLPRTMRVVLSTEKLNAYGLSPMAIVGHLQAANASVQAGNFSENNQEVRVDAGNIFTQREDLEAVVVGVVRGRPVYLRDVADKIVDGPRSQLTMWSTEPRTRVQQRIRAQASIRP